MPEEPHALRVGFVYRGGDVNVQSAVRVAMIAPPSVAMPRGPVAGHSVSIDDADGRTLWSRPLPQAIGADVEVFSPRRDATIARAPRDRIEGSFSVLVPDLPAAHALALHGPPDPARPQEPARELLRVPIETLRRMAAQERR